MSPLLSALVGAAVGGLLALSGNIAVRLFFDRRRRKTLEAALRSEARELGRRASERERAPHTGIAFHSPLPTLAWQEVVRSGNLARMPKKERSNLITLYERVDEANYLSRQAVLLFAISQLTEADPAAGLEAEAVRLSTVPFTRVVQAASVAAAPREASNG
jgi:hypothetical protein